MGGGSEFVELLAVCAAAAFSVVSPDPWDPPVAIAAAVPARASADTATPAVTSHRLGPRRSGALYSSAAPSG
ncbi:hypothetical protein ACFQ9X_40885 [Catenulispora yoronensis]